MNGVIDITYDDDGQAIWTDRDPAIDSQDDQARALAKCIHDYGPTREEFLQRFPHVTASWLREISRDAALAAAGLDDSKLYEGTLDEEAESKLEEAVCEAWPWEWDTGFEECSADAAGALPAWRFASDLGQGGR